MKRTIWILLALLAAGCATGGAGSRRVVVLDETGAPVEGVMIQAVGQAFQGCALTAGDGSAMLRVSPVPVSLVAHKPGYEPTQVNASTNGLIKVLLLRSRP
jgi:hypothetical protein